MTDNMIENTPVHQSTNSPALRFIPLGGVGTFGMNCAVLEFGDEMFVIDAGMKIPQGNFPVVDLFLPDFSYVLENVHRLRAILLTHGTMTT